MLPPDVLTYVRHAETVANATGRYSAKTLNVFSAKGKAQVAALSAKLKPKYDLILVSPSERCLRTAAPYLAKTGQVALVEPLLYECCVGRLPANGAAFPWGQKVTIPSDIGRYFLVRKGKDRLPAPNGKAQEKGQLMAALDAYRKLPKVRSLLIIGHSAMGGKFLKEVTGRWIRVENAKPIVIPKPPE